MFYLMETINEETEIIKKNQIESWHLNMKRVFPPSAIKTIIRRLRQTFSS